MANPVYKYIIKVGKEILGTNSKPIADDLVKQGGKRVPKSQIPDGAKVKKAPSVPNPKTSKGTYTRPQPPAARPKTTAPAKPEAPKSTSPAKPKTDTTAVARPKPKTKAPAVQTKSPAQPKTKKVKPPLMSKDKVKVRVNTPPKPKSTNPAKLRTVSLASQVASQPEIDLKAPTPKTTPGNKSGEMPKVKKVEPKKTTLDKSPRPQARPEKTTKKSTAPKSTPKAATKTEAPKADPLAGWSDPRRKALRSAKIGQDAGDGMKWVVGANSNALVRTRDEEKVKNQLKLQKYLK